MNPKNISDEDLALFAMQLLTPEESAEVLTHLKQSETARQELAQLQSDLAMYALTSKMHAPPALARERLLRRVAKEKKLVPVETPRTASDEPMLMPRVGRPSQREGQPLPIEEGPAPRRRVGLWSWAGWAVAAGLAVAVGYGFHQRQVLQDGMASQASQLAQLNTETAKAQAVMQALTSGGAMQVALHLPVTANAETAKPQAHAAYLAETGALVFVASHLAPLQPYKTYELWVIPADGHDAIPAGTFKPDQRGFASVILPDIPKGVIAGSFGVTIEDDGGSKSPTPPIVLAGM